MSFARADYDPLAAGGSFARNPPPTPTPTPPAPKQSMMRMILETIYEILAKVNEIHRETFAQSK